jgi:hypothetical protein
MARAIAIEVGERDFGDGVGFDVHEGGRSRGCRLARALQVFAPATAALGLIHAHEEGGDDLSQFPRHLVGTLAHFRERIRAHAKQERLECLSRPVEPDVRLGRGGQQAAQRVERLCTDRCRVR